MKRAIQVRWYVIENHVRVFHASESSRCWRRQVCFVAKPIMSTRPTAAPFLNMRHSDFFDRKRKDSSVYNPVSMVEQLSSPLFIEIPSTTSAQQLPGMVGNRWVFPSSLMAFELGYSPAKARNLLGFRGGRRTPWLGLGNRCSIP